MSVVTGANVTQEKFIPKKKKGMKSLEMSPWSNILRTENIQNCPTHLARYNPGCKSLINKAEDDHNDSTDTSCTDK